MIYGDAAMLRNNYKLPSLARRYSEKVSPVNDEDMLNPRTFATACDFKFFSQPLGQTLYHGSVCEDAGRAHTIVVLLHAGPIPNGLLVE